MKKYIKCKYVKENIIMKKYVNASAVGKPEINSISLKSLYDSGVHFLNFGGEIVKTDDNGEEYYDLYSQNTGELFVSDGEMVEFTKHYNISTGLPYWVATTDDGKDIYLTNDEYRIAVYHNNYNIKSSTSIKCSKVIDFTEHSVAKDDVSDADWDQLQHTVNFDYYDSLQKMAQDLVNVIEDDQVWSEVEWNIFHAWYDEKGFTDDDWDYVEACGYERDQF